MKSGKRQEGLVGRCLLIQYDSAKLSAISVDEEKKNPEKAGNESFGK